VLLVEPARLATATTPGVAAGVGAVTGVGREAKSLSSEREREREREGGALTGLFVL